MEEIRKQKEREVNFGCASANNAGGQTKRCSVHLAQPSSCHRPSSVTLSAQGNRMAHPLISEHDDDPPVDHAKLYAYVMKNLRPSDLDDKMRKMKAWLTPDGRWINVTDHYELVPFGDEGFDDIGVYDMNKAGFIRVSYVQTSRYARYLGVEYTSVTSQQRREIEATANQLGAQVIWDHALMREAVEDDLIEEAIDRILEMTTSASVAGYELPLGASPYWKYARRRRKKRTRRIGSDS